MLQAYVLLGRVVTMAQPEVIEHGAVYVAGSTITAALDATAPPPAGFAAAPRIKTRGTIYPGLIELHNHLAYDVLPLWKVPRLFTNRDQWSTGPVYRGLISGPMNVLGQTNGLPEAVVRYVEAKALLGGTTTSQGIALYSDPGIGGLYFGVVRNVESPHDAVLPAAATRIADVDATDATKFLARLQAQTCLLLHLAEGTDAAAEGHFQALHVNGSWALAPSLGGIHCVPLTSADFGAMAAAGAAMVWSPLSNLLLYGRTADVAAARAAGVRIGIGSDWAPSGSKNLLHELRIARFVADGAFSDRELLAMATTTAAEILGWQASVGSIEAGKRADLLVVAGRGHDAHAHLFECRETDVAAVVIDGVARAGTARLMGELGVTGAESVRVGSTRRLLNLPQMGADPAIADLTLGEATRRLRDALANLPQLALALEAPALARPTPRFTLLLDHDEVGGQAVRPHLPGPGGAPTATLGPDLAAAIPLSTLLQPLQLDPLTVASDGEYATTLSTAVNLPDALKAAIPTLL